MQSSTKSVQKTRSSEQLEFTRIVRPNARLPTGGKQPSESVHVCCAEAELRSEMTMTRRRAKHEGERNLKWVVVLVICWW